MITVATNDMAITGNSDQAVMQFKNEIKGVYEITNLGNLRWFLVLNLYVIYAQNGIINILLPFTDLLCNAQPYIARPASLSSHLHL